MNNPLLIFTCVFLALLAFVWLANKVSIYEMSRNKEGRIKIQEKYSYKNKPFLMTKSENEFIQMLFNELRDDYRIYPQIHLSNLVDHRSENQSRKGAFAHVNGKSVDFVICDKLYSRPLCAIELDDWSHDTDGAKEKDAVKENILQMAGIPLVRFRDWSKLNRTEMINEIKTKLQQ